MWEWLALLIDPSDFPARWICGNWSELHGWTHIIADLLTFAAYTAIPCVLVYFISKRKDLVFPKVFWFFCAFIFSCGTVHLIEAFIFWYPAYRLSAAAKVITAISSWATLIVLWQVTPKALALPGLAVINEQLRNEIEERKKITEDLHQNQDRLHLALQSSKAGTWSRDLVKNIGHWSPTTYKLFDLDESNEDISFDTFLNVIHPDDRKRIGQVFDDAIHAGKPYDVEFRVIWKNGEIHHLSSTAKVYFDEQKNPLLITGIISDITKQKLQEEKQREFEERIQQSQKLESLGVLAGGIAHDFNNLLVGVLGNASLASEKLSDTSPVKEYVKQIENAAKRASELTKQMLAYSGKGKFVISQIHLNQFVIELSDLLRVMLESCGFE